MKCCPYSTWWCHQWNRNCLKAFGAPDLTSVWWDSCCSNLCYLDLFCFTIMFQLLLVFICLVFWLFVVLYLCVFVCFFYLHHDPYTWLSPPTSVLCIFSDMLWLIVAICQCPQFLSHIDCICYATNWHPFIFAKCVFDSPRAAGGHPFRNGCTQSYFYAPGLHTQFMPQSRQLQKM